MKKIIIIAMLLTLPIMANAGEKDCSSVADFAKNIMQARQGGVPMNEVMDFIESAKDSPRVYKVMKSITIMAYEKSRYSTPSIRKRVIEDFYNDVYLTCIKSN